MKTVNFAGATWPTSLCLSQLLECANSLFSVSVYQNTTSSGYTLPSNEHCILEAPHLLICNGINNSFVQGTPYYFEVFDHKILSQPLKN